MRKQLEYVLTAGTVLLTCLTAAVPPLQAAPAPVDPALVGVWKSNTQNLTWTVRSDGTYTLSGNPNDTGKLQASGGQWTSMSDTTHQTASGTYTLNGPNAFSTTGLSGSLNWQRAFAGDRTQSSGGNTRTWYPEDRKARRRNPIDPKAENKRGLELYRAGKKVDARRVWQRVLKMGDPQAVKQARNYLARFR